MKGAMRAEKTKMEAQMMESLTRTSICMERIMMQELRGKYTRLITKANFFKYYREEEQKDLEVPVSNPEIQLFDKSSCNTLSEQQIFSSRYLASSES